MTYEVKLTELATTTAAHLRIHTRTADIGDAVGQGFKELYEFAGRADAVPTGPPQLAYPGGFDPHGEMDLDLYVPISTAPAANGGIDIVDLPGGPAAQTFHHGRYQEIRAAYEAVFTLIHRNGHHHAGPPRESYLNGTESGLDGHLTEVVVPLRRS